MASPPSDGSQSWDKWGPVATPAPILIPVPVANRPSSIFSTSWKLVSDTDFSRPFRRGPEDERLRGPSVGGVVDRA
jgi:hypothetical protein